MLSLLRGERVLGALVKEHMRDLKRNSLGCDCDFKRQYFQMDFEGELVSFWIESSVILTCTESSECVCFGEHYPV